MRVHAWQPSILFINLSFQMATDPDPEKLLRGWVRGPPPEWKPEKAYHECNHCNEKFERSHRHNCRL